MDQKTDKPLIQLAPNELHLFEHMSSRYAARIPVGVKPEDLLVPGFWAHFGQKLRPMDEIRAHAEDGTWMANYLVLDCSRTWAKVKQLSLHHLGTADVALTQSSEADVQAFIDAHKVSYRGQHKWCVVRTADGAVLAEGLGQKDDATTWLKNHAREVLGAPAAPLAAKTDAVTA